jgi:PD-(D/E)XK nuclease family transposase
MGQYKKRHRKRPNKRHRNRLPHPSFDQIVPSYVSKAYSWFGPMFNKSNELMRLKFISVIRFRLTKSDYPSYIWHRPENFTYQYKGNQKKFSYSVVELNQFTKTNDQVKTLQDKWFTLLVHGSDMTEKEANEIFGDEPMFQEIFQLLNFSGWAEYDRREYALSQKT